jgi:hypothetical protein
VGAHARLKERRRSNRPRNGDEKPCPKCGAACEFNERYRFDDVGIAPAWTCGAPPCHHRELVRRTQRKLNERDHVRQSRDMQARAKRLMMKSRARTERSHQRLANSEARLKKS